MWGLIAVLRWPQAQPASKKNRPLIAGRNLRLPSHGTLRDLFPRSRWPRVLVAFINSDIFFFYFSAHMYCWMFLTSLFNITYRLFCESFVSTG